MGSAVAPNGNENAIEADAGDRLARHPRRPKGDGRVDAAVEIQQCC